MQPPSPTVRRLVAGLFAVGVLFQSAPALARAGGEARTIRRTLVGIEKVLATAERERRDLGPRAWTMERRVEALHREVRGLRAAGRIASLDVLLDLVEMETGRRAAVRRMGELDALIEALREKRAVVIDELQQLVLQRAATRAIDRASASWSSGGTLITYSADWEAVAMCESSGRWKIDGRFDGGLQFEPTTWIGFGGAEFARFAYDATKKQQITIAERVLAIQGPKAWPNCFRPLSTL